MWIYCNVVHSVFLNLHLSTKHITPNMMHFACYFHQSVHYVKTKVKRCVFSICYQLHSEEARCTSVGMESHNLGAVTKNALSWATTTKTSQGGGTSRGTLWRLPS